MDVGSLRDQRREDEVEGAGAAWAPEEEEPRSPVPSRRRRRVEDDEEDAPRKAAWPLRLLVWGSLLALFFGVGYGMATWMLRWMDAQGKISQPNLVDSPEKAQKLLEKGPEQTVNIRRGDYRLYLLGKNGLETKTLGVIPGVAEEDLRACLEAVLEPLQAEAGGQDAMRVLHLFRAGDMLYLDINQPFLTALGKLPSERGILFMTGLVRSVVENFPPSVQVQMLVNGKMPSSKGPVDLTVPWTLAPHS